MNLPYDAALSCEHVARDLPMRLIPKENYEYSQPLRAALAENPFVKGEGMAPRTRRELLSHAQLVLDL